MSENKGCSFLFYVIGGIILFCFVGFAILSCAGFVYEVMEYSEIE